MKIRYVLIRRNRTHQKGPENIERKGENTRAESSRCNREFISLRGCHDSMRMSQSTRGQRIQHQRPITGKRPPGIRGQHLSIGQHRNQQRKSNENGLSRLQDINTSTTTDNKWSNVLAEIMLSSVPVHNVEKCVNSITLHPHKTLTTRSDTDEKEPLPSGRKSIECRKKRSLLYKQQQ